MARDLASYRDEFEVVRRKAYLISASLGPVGDRSKRHLDDYIRAWSEKGAPDHVWFEDIFPAMGRLKRSFSALAGCDPDEVALTTNISIALATIASCLDLTGERRRIVLSELDFPTDGHVWRAWADRTGAELVWLRSPDGRTLPLEVYDAAIDERTALVMVNRVLYRSSAVVDAAAVCAMARERGALSFVDDYHGIGVLPLDLHDARLRPLRGRHAEVPLRRTGMRVPVRTPGAPPLAPAGDHRVVRHGRAVLLRHGASRVPRDRAAARARDPAGAGRTSSRRAAST